MMSEATASPAESRPAPVTGSAAPDGAEAVDVVIVGAGFAGMYMLHRLRGLGLRAVVLEAGDDVGGTWYWNRYPGARVDVECINYSFSFSPDLEQDYRWSGALRAAARDPQVRPPRRRPVRAAPGHPLRAPGSPRPATTSRPGPGGSRPTAATPSRPGTS